MTGVPLPLVVLGPILRRVEPRSASVFIATSKPASIHLSLYDGATDSANPGPEMASVDVTATRFGAQFYATVATVTLAEPTTGPHGDGSTAGQLPMLAGHRYSYDVRITPDGGAAQSLKDLGMLEDLDPPLPGYGTADPDNPAAAEVEVCGISYADGQLPSFVLPPDDIADLVLLHTSCRKPHGYGDPAMQYFDGVIDDLQGADAGWPHQLFLTGDQIYADDVAAALAPGITALGIALVSGDGGSAGPEQVPSPVDETPLNVSTTVLPPGFRQRPAGLAGLTSEASACHLIGFGEYLAMYCLAWNPLLWPVLAVADTSAFTDSANADLKAKIDHVNSKSPDDAPRVLGRPTPDAPDAVITPLYGSTPEARDALTSAFQGFYDDKRQLDGFRREVAKVRRVMANVPTYMICDDHDVTDDWFMTGEIRTNTTTRLFGRALIRNALAAYVVCQAWGDDPHAWATDPDKQAVLQAVSEMFPESWTGGLPVASAVTTFDTTLGLGPGMNGLFDFSFSVDGPMHHVRVLDTRTRREYATPQSSPGLLTSPALDLQLPQSDLDDMPPDHVLVVVSPCPVVGPPVLAEIVGPILVVKEDLVSLARSASAQMEQQDLTGIPRGRPTGLQFYDIEQWATQPLVFERLLERLSHHPRTVVLGGDVHYAGSFAMDWTDKTGRTTRMVHFTSSAAHNAWGGARGPTLVRNLMLYSGMATGLQRIGLPMVKLGWADSLPPVVSDVSHEAPLARVRVRSGPVLLTDQLFRQQHPLTREPDWAWRLDAIVDTRASADRPAGARQTVAAEVAAGPDAVHHYGDLATAHVQALTTVAVNRGLQYLCNVGVVRFSVAGSALSVRQELYSLRPEPEANEKADKYIVHEAGLDPVPIVMPTTVGPGA